MYKESYKELINPSEFTLLVVDDEEDICEGLKYQFETEGFKVLTAQNGKSAFEVIKK